MRTLTLVCLALLAGCDAAPLDAPEAPSMPPPAPPAVAGPQMSDTWFLRNACDAPRSLGVWRQGEASMLDDMPVKLFTGEQFRRVITCSAGETLCYGASVAAPQGCTPCAAGVRDVVDVACQ